MAENIDLSLTQEQADHRRRAFDHWLRRTGDRLGFYLLPSHRQDEVRGMLRRAYYAGSNYEARINTIE